MSRQEQDIILTREAKPYPSEKLASAAMKRMGIAEEDYGILPEGGGFAIVRKESAAWKLKQAGEQTSDGQPRAKSTMNAASADQFAPYYWVKFHERSDPNQTLRVELSVNSDTLTFKRGARVPVPKPFLEAADHTKQPKFRQVAGEDRKIVGEFQTYNYDILGDATREDYLKFRREGTQELVQKIHQHDV